MTKIALRLAYGCAAVIVAGALGSLSFAQHAPAATTSATPVPGRYAAGRPRPTPEPAEFQPRLDPRLASYVPTSKSLTGALRGMASDILPGISKLWIDGFRKYHPQVTIQVGPPYGGRTGAAELVEGGIDFAFVSRELIPTDIEQFQKKFSYPPLSVPVSGGAFRHFGFLDAMGVIVSRDNPLQRITFAQFDAIFSSTRHRGHAPIRKWGELGLTGEWVAKDIHPYGVKPWNGFEEFIRQRILSVPGKRGEWREDMTFDDLVFPMTTQVSRDDQGISYTGFAYLMGGARLVPISESDSGPFSNNTFVEVANWKHPLSRMFYINVNRKPGAPMSPVLAEFIRFILSKDGQQLIVKDALFLPLSADLSLKSRKLIE